MASPSEMSLMCRLCLLKDEKQVNIPIFEDRSDNKLLVKISALLPLKISKEDQLPKNICDLCSDKLNLLYEFRKTSLDSEQTLLSWLKDDNLPINALAEQIAIPEEIIVKEEIEAEEETPYLDLAQYSSIDEFQEAEDEEAEAPPAKRPRRFAAVKPQISIAPESDNYNDEDELDTVNVEAIAKVEDESEKSDNNEDIAKLENESDESYSDLSSLVTEYSAYEQPGPSGLGKSGAKTPFMLKNEYLEEDIKNELKVSDIQLIGTNGIFIKEEDNNSSDANSSRRDVIRKFQCYTCNAIFKTKSNLKDHLITHSGIRPLTTHLLTHFYKKDFRCNICNFKTEGDLKKHLMTHLNIYPFECDTCKAKFSKKCLLKSHQLTHSDIFLFECDTCKTKFKRKDNLKNHKLTHSEIYAFKCDTCKAKFKRKGDLKGHILTHSNIFPFECNTCKAKFKRKYHLKNHILLHSDIYPFECETCDAKFKLKNYLERHMLTHSDIYPFECDTCKAKFKRAGELNRHISTH